MGCYMEDINTFAVVGQSVAWIRPNVAAAGSDLECLESDIVELQIGDRLLFVFYAQRQCGRLTRRQVISGNRNNIRAGRRYVA